jgi:hypothetical protein
MSTPDSGPPNITDYYFGGSVSGWNAGVWDERPSNFGNVTRNELHNFAPIVISDFDAGRPLTFNLCGNGYFYGPPSGSALYANVLIAQCTQFYNSGETQVNYTQIFNEGASGEPNQNSGMICFDFTTTRTIPFTCEFHAAVALVIVSDQVDDSKFDFSYQLRVSQ